MVCQGNGIYCATFPAASIYYNNSGPALNELGHRRMIAVRVLPGTVATSTHLFGEAGPIGTDEFDSSRYDDGVYVIRRSCQVLPCFVIHY